MNDNIFESVDSYISDLVAPEDDILRETLLSLEDIPNMSVSATQGKFLQTLAKAANAKNILELGTFAGYSTIWMARMLPENGKLITLEYNEKHAAIAQKNIKKAGLTEKVEIRIGKGLDILPKLKEETTEPFDFIFIDADKQPYAEYFDWAVKLSRPGTIIVADNVIRNGAVLDKNSSDDKVQGVHRLNEMLSKRTDVTATIIQMIGIKEHDGMAIAVVN